MIDRRTGKADSIAGEIMAIARRDGLQPGDRLVEQRLAAALGVSRGPIRAGLRRLADAGIIAGQRNVGFVLAKSPSSRIAGRVMGAAHTLEHAYRAIAKDRLEGTLPETVTEAALMRRYDMGRPDLLRLLDRIAAEGWIARRPGYGWRFADTLTRPEAYAQANDFRRVIEPAAMRTPGFTIDAATLDRLRGQQLRVLQDGLDRLSMAEIFQLGCEFHEEIARGASNPFFVEALRRVNSIRRLFTYRILRDAERIARHIDEHLRIIDLLADGHVGAAADLMHAHLGAGPD